MRSLLHRALRPDLPLRPEKPTENSPVEDQLTVTNQPVETNLTGYQYVTHN